MWTSRRAAVRGQGSGVGDRAEAIPQRRLHPPVGGLLVVAFFCLFPVPCFLPPAFAAGTRYEVREVKPQVYVWIPEDIIEEDGDPDFTRAGTAGFIVTREGVIVVDTTNTPFHGRELLYEIRQRTQQPVTYVVDTNGTSDQVLGNEVFLDLNATILATPGVEAAMRERQQQLNRLMAGDGKLQRRMRGIHVKLPDRTFEGEMRLRPGGQEIRLMSLDTGGSDLAVYLPAAKLVFLGDLFENGYVPQLEPGSESRNIHHWIDALRTVEAWDAEVYVPGHGEPGGKKDVAAFRGFLEWLSNEVQTRIAERKSLEQTKTELVPVVENYHWRAPELAPGVVSAVYQQLVEESSHGKEPPSAPKN